MNDQYSAIGLKKEYSENINEMLNQLLADFTIYYHNLRGLHWNIKGEHFFQLHEKFEELYTRAAGSIDEIAERIVTLEGRPVHTLEGYLETSQISSLRDISNDVQAVNSITENLSVLLLDERRILEQANENMDEGTADMVTSLINKQEKDHWMMRAWLGNSVHREAEVFEF